MEWSARVGPLHSAIGGAKSDYFHFLDRIIYPSRDGEGTDYLHFVISPIVSAFAEIAAECRLISEPCAEVQDAHSFPMAQRVE